MFNQLANFLVKILIWLSSLVVTVLTFPIYNLLRPFLPQLPTQLETFSYFLTNYVFRGLAFAREVFFNVTGYPRELFYALLTFFLFKLGLRITLLVFSFIIKIYYIIRGSSVSTNKP